MNLCLVDGRLLKGREVNLFTNYVVERVYSALLVNVVVPVMQSESLFLSGCPPLLTQPLAPWTVTVAACAICELCGQYFSQLFFMFNPFSPNVLQQEMDGP